MGSKSPEQEDAIRPDEVRIGRVSGVFGISGEVRLFLHNRESELLSGKGMKVTLVSPEGIRQVRHLRSRQGTGKRVLGLLEGVDNPEIAREYIDWEIVVDPGALPSTGDDEYYQRDLIGLEVKTASGALVGTLTEVMEGPAVDCWVVRGPDGEVMFPAIKQVVIDVDLDKGIVIAEHVEDLEG